MIIAKDGTAINQQGNNIYVSNGEVYILNGKILMGSGGIISQNCSSVQEALGVVIGMHGGRKI